MKLGITYSSFLHLRLPFSFFLLPVYLFALSQVPLVNVTNALLVFVILHLMIYPASNGYNSYFDKDEGSIALLKKPPMVDKSLFYLSVCLEWLAVFIAAFFSIKFMACIIIYIIFSRAYSHPLVRLKKYPIISFFVVFIFQGWFIYFATYLAVSNSLIGTISQTFIPGIICSCLIGASYPLTQIYQHKEDAKRGDITLSILLGIKGSFAFSALIFTLGMLLMYYYCITQTNIFNFWIFLLACLPVLGYFIFWFLKVLKDNQQANFRNMMQMTSLSGGCMLAYFVWLLFSS